MIAQLDLFGIGGLGDHARHAAPAPPPRAPEPDQAEPSTGGSIPLLRRLVWGKLKSEDGYPWFIGSGYCLDIRQGPDGLEASEHYAMGMSGGGGPFRPVEAATADEAIQRHLLRQLEKCADYTHGGWRHDETQAAGYAKLAQWCIAHLPPMFFPKADAAAHYERACAVASEREDRRCAMLRATDAIEKQLHAAAIEGGFYAYPELIQDKDECNGSTESFHASFKGEWCIAGHAPDRLEVVIYSRCERPWNGEGATAQPLLERARDLFAAAVEVPVRLATEAEHELCYSDRRAVTW